MDLGDDAPPPMVGSFGGFGGEDLGVFGGDAALAPDPAPERQQPQSAPQSPPQLPLYDPTPPRAPAVRAGPRMAVPMPPPPPVFPPGYVPAGPMPMGYGPGGPMPMRPPGMRGFGDDTAASSSNLLGLALLAVPVGGYVGSRYAGLLGAVGGALGAGAAVNSVRAARNFWGDQGPDSKSEAMVSATYALLGFAVAGYLLYRGHSSSRAKKNEASPNARALAPSRKNWL